MQECNQRHGCPWCSGNSNSSSASISRGSFWFRFHWYSCRSSFFCFQKTGIPCIQVSIVQLIPFLLRTKSFVLMFTLFKHMYTSSHALLISFYYLFLYQPPNCSEPIWCCNKTSDFGVKDSWKCERCQGYLSGTNIDSKLLYIFLLVNS